MPGQLRSGDRTGTQLALCPSPPPVFNPPSSPPGPTYRSGARHPAATAIQQVRGSTPDDPQVTGSIRDSTAIPQVRGSNPNKSCVQKEQLRQEVQGSTPDTDSVGWDFGFAARQAALHRASLHIQHSSSALVLLAPDPTSTHLVPPSLSPAHSATSPLHPARMAALSPLGMEPTPPPSPPAPMPMPLAEPPLLPGLAPGPQPHPCPRNISLPQAPAAPSPLPYPYNLPSHTPATPTPAPSPLPPTTAPAARAGTGSSWAAAAEEGRGSAPEPISVTSLLTTALPPKQQQGQGLHPASQATSPPDQAQVVMLTPPHTSPLTLTATANGNEASQPHPVPHPLMPPHPAPPRGLLGHCCPGCWGGPAPSRQGRQHPGCWQRGVQR